jgi:hypothetical protein
MSLGMAFSWPSSSSAFSIYLCLNDFLDEHSDMHELSYAEDYE